MNSLQATTREIRDEYELNQLIPIYSKNDGRVKTVDPSQNQIEKLDDKLPAVADSKMQFAIFEAIVDEVVADQVQDAIENGEAGEYPDEEKIAEQVEPMIEAAEMRHLIAKYPRRRLNALIAKHLKRSDPMYQLAEKAAHYCAGVMSDVIEDVVVAGDLAPSEDVPTVDVTPSDTKGSDEYGLDESPADTGIDISEEVVEPTPADVVVDENVPTAKADIIRYMTASTINHKKATVIMSNKISGKYLANTLYELRHCLPENFKRKYRLYY